jgi:hypothetical protein
MKRSIFLLLTGFITLQSYAQENWCGTDQVQQRLKEKYSGYAEHLHKAMTKAAEKGSNGNKAILYIPVVVHIIHDNGVGNISDKGDGGCTVQTDRGGYESSVQAGKD